MKERIASQKRIFKYVLLIFAIVIIIADACLLIMHNKSFSESENRMLAQAPKLTVDNLMSGKFMTQSDSFVADQFPLRDDWIQLKLKADRLLGRQTSNGVYLGKDGYLIEDAAAPLEPSYSKNLAAISLFANTYPELNMVMTVVPNAVSICDQLMPENAPIRDQMEDLAYIQKIANISLDFVDLTDTLKAHKEEYIYYKSDHHWTSLGAKYAFEEMAPALGIDPSELITDYDIITVADDFTGTMASNSGDFSVKDSIDIYMAKAEDFQYVVEYVDQQKKSATIYNSSALEQKNKYEVFLGGNHPQINIKTTNLNDRNLMIFKDSYANTFLQFLLPYYQSITIIDPRYYSDDCSKLISEGEITDVLFLYNMNTYAEDNSLAAVLLDE
ncbi:MAG: DHHW family protein [Lachnospiraceae bacterium]|nr:DHHW family protein [Lachnospiraceae bacterium]